MPSYPTYDAYNDLSPTAMGGATRIHGFQPITSSAPITYVGAYDNYVIPTGKSKYETFVVTLTQGATYSIQSSSFFEPSLKLYDHVGNYLGGAGDSLYGDDLMWVVAPYTGDYYIVPGWDPGLASGNTWLLLVLKEDVGTITRYTLNGTDEREVLVGQTGPAQTFISSSEPTNRNEFIYAWGGDDVIWGNGGDDIIYGGTGFDVAHYHGSYTEYRTSPSGTGGMSLSDKVGDRSGHDVLYDVERIQFSGGGGIALDINGNGGLAARAIAAAMGRGYADHPFYYGQALHLLDAGNTLDQVMTNLIASTYPGKTPTQLVTAIYTNVVGHAPSPNELANYTGLITSGQATAGELAAVGAMTDINAWRIGLAAHIDTGFWFI